MKAAVIIPIYKPDNEFLEILAMLKRQKKCHFNVIILETAADGTMDYSAAVKGLNYKIEKVQPADFNHGLTRQHGVDLAGNIDVAVFLTQDAVPADDMTIHNLVRSFTNPEIGCAFGRQLPKADASVMSAHARLFNYPAESYVRSFEDKEKYGIKTVFSSDSFAAYRVSALKEIGGFPKVSFSEDMCVTAKMLMQGWKAAYAADAKVFHSHNYTIMEEFYRYREIGAFHKQQPWIMETFGKAEGEGIRFVKSQIAYLCKKNPLLLIPMVIRNGMKFIAFKM